MYRNSILEKMEISIIRKLAFKMKEYEDGINLTIGEPLDDVEPELKKYMADLILNEKLGYTNPGGLIELRKVYTEFYNKYFEADYEFDECVVHNGATEAIQAVLISILENNDEVIVPLPAYPGYEPNILLRGAKPVFIGDANDDYKITSELIEKSITEKTKAIILTYPNNPTGFIMSKEEMDKVAKLIEKHNIYLISDEIYASLTFEKYYSFARYHNLKEKIIIITGMSKSHSMTGFRIGYSLTNKKLSNIILKASQYGITGTTTLCQYASIKAIEWFPTRENIIKRYKEKIDYLIKELTKLGFKCYEPKGAFYLFVDYTTIEKLKNYTSFEFANDLIEKVRVGVVPSIAFRVEGAIRISVNKEMDVLEDFIKRMKEYLEIIG